MSEESSGSVRYSENPSNRFEAFLYYFPQYFIDGNILELGAGNGKIISGLLALNLEFARFLATDLTETRLINLQNNIQDPRIETKILNAEDIPKDLHHKFDAVIMIALIEHLIDPISALKNIKKVLKPGGFVYIDTPNIAKITRRIKLCLGHFPSTASLAEGLITYDGEKVDLYDEGHLHYFTYRSLSRLLKELCGYSRVEKLSYFSGPFYLGKKMGFYLSLLWPEMFSEIALVAYP
jgi:SAM-dependent methyltransferase